MFKFTFTHTIDCRAGTFWIEGEREFTTSVMADTKVEAEESLHNLISGFERVGRISFVRCEAV